MINQNWYYHPNFVMSKTYINELSWTIRACSHVSMYSVHSKLVSVHVSVSTGLTPVSVYIGSTDFNVGTGQWQYRSHSNVSVIAGLAPMSMSKGLTPMSVSVQDSLQDTIPMSVSIQDTLQYQCQYRTHSNVSTGLTPVTVQDSINVRKRHTPMSVSIQDSLQCQCQSRSHSNVSTGLTPVTVQDSRQCQYYPDTLQCQFHYRTRSNVSVSPGLTPMSVLLKDSLECRWRTHSNVSVSTGLAPISIYS